MLLAVAIRRLWQLVVGVHHHLDDLGGGVVGTITVSAASSLSTVFPALATRFEALHPGTTVNFDFGSSGTLATQILNGAPADVFAAAAPAPMAMVQAAHLIAGSPTTFARNRLEIVVEAGESPRNPFPGRPVEGRHRLALCRHRALWRHGPRRCPTPTSSSPPRSSLWARTWMPPWPR